ncbi:phosphatase PAP2 family protein [Micromonospora vulcania]|uniref:Phosphatase PAP2 family protein n=1 Tax=Micromonospora vulcania TaxID=1441873 RepID=A0ABW1HAE8_9ACTN
MLKPTAVRRDLRLRPVRPAGWWFDLLLLVGFGVLTLALARGALLGIDLAVREWAYDHHPAPIYWTARVFNFLGQGGWLLMPLSVALALAAAWRARTVRPLLLVAGAFVLLYLTIGPLKVWTDRAAPSSKLPPADSVRIFNDLPPLEYDLSYPSGHVANAIVWYGVIAVLLTALTAGRLHPTLHRLVRFAPPAILLVTTTYLNFHWLTDGVAALLLGLLLDRLLHRVPWDDLPLPGRLRRWDGPFTSYP